MLALSGVLLVGFGVLPPSSSAASIAPFVADGRLGVAAGFRPERRFAGHRVDFVVLRGLGTPCLVAGTLVVGASRLVGGDRFGLAVVALVRSCSRPASGPCSTDRRSSPRCGTRETPGDVHPAGGTAAATCPE